MSIILFLIAGKVYTEVIIICTAVSYLSKDHYFGRNLDLEKSFGEKVIITPKNFALTFKNGQKLCSHHAFIGIGVLCEDYPLYFEATNEKGLSVAGLNFPKNAKYSNFCDSKINLAPFELIPYLLGSFDSVSSAKEKLQNISLWDINFSSALPSTPLHWLIADKHQSITLESTKIGLNIYDNPVGVLTNNPPFDYHLFNLANYMSLTPAPPKNNQPITLDTYSLGMGSFSLPGDMSSPSRFVRAAFTKMHSVCQNTEQSAVNQFFHILGSAAQPKGLTMLENKEYEYTRYSCCCNTDKGIFYYTTYDNPQITALHLQKENLFSSRLIAYPLKTDCSVFLQN